MEIMELHNVKKTRSVSRGLLGILTSKRFTQTTRKNFRNYQQNVRFFSFFIGLSCLFAAPNLASAQDTLSLPWAVAPTLSYDRVHPFQDGFAVVSKNGLSGVIDKAGKVILPTQYRRIITFASPYIYVQHNDLYGCFDTTGRTVLPVTSKTSAYFNRGVAHTSVAGKYYVINSKGKTLSESTNPFIWVNPQLFAVQRDGLWGFVDASLKTIVKPRYQTLEVQRDGNILVSIDKKFGISQGKNKELVPPRYDYIHYQQEISSAYTNGKAEGIETATGKVLFSLEASEIYPFVNGLARVHVGNRYGFVNTKGKWALPCIYELAYDMQADLIRLTYQKKAGAVDKTGKTVIPFEYDVIEPFWKGIARVNVGGKWGAIDKTGKVIAPPIYSEMEQNPATGCLWIQQDNAWYFVDASTGKLRGGYEEATLNEWEDGLICVKKDGKWGYVNTAGETIIPFVFERAESFGGGYAPARLNGLWGILRYPTR